MKMQVRILSGGQNITNMDKLGFIFAKNYFTQNDSSQFVNPINDLYKIEPTKFFYPYLNIEEFDLFESTSKDKQNILEFGSGGSTIYFLDKQINKLYSVESNPEFFTFMNSIDLVKSNIDYKLIYKHIDIGETNQWGYPLNNDKQSYWANYYTEIWNTIEERKQYPELIYIDGRFRVCCALFSILNIIDRNLTTDIMIHDFWCRPEYRVLLEYLDTKETVNQLVVFKPKENIELSKITSDLLKYTNQLI